jgi:hypothetical protein
MNEFFQFFCLLFLPLLLPRFRVMPPVGRSAEPAETMHNMKEIPEEVLAKVRAAIRDE